MPAPIRFALRCPRRALALIIAVTLGAGIGVTRLELRTDGGALTPEGRAEVVLDRRIREEFDFVDAFVVLIRSQRDEGVFHSETLDLIRRLTADFAEIDGVSERHLTSLATERSFRRRPDSLKFQTLLEPPLRSRRAVARLREDIQKIGLYTGTLVSADGNGAAIYVGIPHGVDRARLYRDLTSAIAARRGTAETIDVIGAPAAELLLGRHILEDLGVGALVPSLMARDANQAASGFKRVLQTVGLLPLAILIMAAVFYGAYRRMAAAWLPLLEALACLVFVFGLMGWTGVPVYLTLAVMPVILVAMGVTDEIHIFNRYVGLARQDKTASGVSCATGALEEMWRPVVKTSVTTAVGFLSFAVSPIGPVKAFGVFTSVGILFCMAWSLIAVPALLALTPVRFLAAREGGVSPGLGAWAVRLGGWTMRRRGATLAAAAIFLAALPFGALRLQVQDSWIGGFSPASEFRRTVAYFDAQFHGSHILLLALDGGYRNQQGETTTAAMEDHRFVLPGQIAEDPALLVESRLAFAYPDQSGRADHPRFSRQWSSYIQTAVREEGGWRVATPRQSGSPLFWLKPEPDDTLRYEVERKPFLTRDTLARAVALKEFVLGRRDLGVGGALAPTDYLETTAFMLRPEEEGARRLPEGPKPTRDLWSRYRFMRGEVKLRQLLDANFGRALIAVYLEQANFKDTARLMAALRDYEAERLKPHGMSLQFGGDVAVSQALIDNIVLTQLSSLSLTLAGILLAAVAMSRSWRWGLYAATPSALAVLANFALMGWLAIPLGVATSMFAAMTLGLGVDFSIHLLDRYRLAGRQGMGAAAAIKEALAETGSANFINALALALGFGVLVFSRIPANGRLGLLVMSGVVMCALASTLLIPALLRRFPVRR